jgi:hypothetical protein
MSAKKICQAIFISGKNKGKTCGKKTQGEFCGIHSRIKSTEKKHNYEDLKVERKCQDSITYNTRNMKKMCEVITGEQEKNLDKMYEVTIKSIMTECKTINMSFSKMGDGRIISAVKEKEYLDTLSEKLLQKYPDYKIEIPKERFWYDIRINTIPINLKLTTGKTDNAFNKRAITSTISRVEPCINQNTNFNTFYQDMRKYSSKNERQYTTEYHYLVVNKNTGQVLLKSILDIHTYKKNSSNILQINWDNEFKNLSYMTPADKTREKIIELLKVIQTSLREAYERSKLFIDADIENDFSK